MNINNCIVLALFLTLLKDHCCFIYIYSSDVVTEFLDEYLSKAKAMLNQEPEKVVEFSLLVIQCLEVYYQITTCSCYTVTISY